MASTRLRERMVLLGGTAMLALAIFGTIARRPFKRLHLGAHRDGEEHADDQQDVPDPPPPAGPP